MMRMFYLLSRWLGGAFILAGLAGGMPAQIPAKAEPPRVIPETAWARLGPHPRLFATAAQWQTLTRQVETNEVSRQLYTLVQKRAVALLKIPPVVIKMRDRGTMSGSMLQPAREVQERVLALAFMARMTGDARFRDRALLELKILTALPDWNPAVYLDTAEATLAMAVGYDWLYDTLTAQDREQFAAAISAKGLRPSFDSPAKMLGWVRGNNNWNQVCHGAMVIGALAVAEREPALARQVVQRAADDLHYSANAYAPDGVYPEGPMYWAYGTTFHVAMLAALETGLGSRFGLDEFPGFLATANYLTQVTAPSGQVFNYADAHEDRNFEPVMFWFSRRLQQPAVASWELSRLTSTAKGKAVPASRFLPLALFWFDPSLSAGTNKILPLHWKGDGINPVAVHRSAWNDPHAAYLAIKGGKAGCSHGHMDVGSFVLEADGVRWAVDLGIQTYGTLYQSGIDAGLWRFQQDSQRWSVFRIGADGHNILRFNGAQPLVSATAPITRFAGGSTTPHTLLDLTPVYAKQVKSVQRGVQMWPDRHMVIQDEWTASEQTVEVNWQWLTFADVTFGKQMATLRQGGETLRVHVLEPSTATLEVQDAAKLLQPHDQANPGLRRLVIRTRTPANATGRFVILVEPGGVSGMQKISVRSLKEW